MYSGTTVMDLGVMTEIPLQHKRKLSRYHPIITTRSSHNHPTILQIWLLIHPLISERSPHDPPNIIQSKASVGIVYGLAASLHRILSAPRQGEVTTVPPYSAHRYREGMSWEVTDVILFSNIPIQGLMMMLGWREILFRKKQLWVTKFNTLRLYCTNVYSGKPGIFSLYLIMNLP